MNDDDDHGLSHYPPACSPLATLHNIVSRDPSLVRSLAELILIYGHNEECGCAKRHICHSIQNVSSSHCGWVTIKIMANNCDRSIITYRNTDHGVVVVGGGGQGKWIAPTEDDESLQFVTPD